MSPIETVAALAVALLWGLQFVTSKLGVAALPPLLFVALRFAAVALLLLPFAGRPSRSELRVAALLSVCFGSLCFGMFFTGLALGSAGFSAALSQLMTPFALIFAVPVAGERPSRRKPCSASPVASSSCTSRSLTLIAGSLVCMTGVLLTQTVPSPAAFPTHAEVARCIPPR